MKRTPKTKTFRAGRRVRLTRDHKWAGESGTITIGMRVAFTDGWEVQLDLGNRCFAQESRMELL